MRLSGQRLGIGRYIEYLLKHGLYTPGMNIPVHGVERLLEDMPP